MFSIVGEVSQSTMSRHAQAVWGLQPRENDRLQLMQGSQGLDNLLYSADADFSCFADLAVTSPVDYYLEGQGSLMQCVLTPATQYMPMPNEDIAARVHQQVTFALEGCRCQPLSVHSADHAGTGATDLCTHLHCTS